MVQSLSLKGKVGAMETCGAGDTLRQQQCRFFVPQSGNLVAQTQVVLVSKFELPINSNNGTGSNPKFRFGISVLQHPTLGTTGTIDLGAGCYGAAGNHSTTQIWPCYWFDNCE
ncbi:MAG: hypothetical protein CM15mV35_220 [uncultured marine virus]|nr:MAG: hypothetical protein CM15mV35_220 [uncultured marine virus]